MKPCEFVAILQGNSATIKPLLINRCAILEGEIGKFIGQKSQTNFNFLHSKDLEQQAGYFWQKCGEALNLALKSNCENLTEAETNLSSALTAHRKNSRDSVTTLEIGINALKKEIKKIDLCLHSRADKQLISDKHLTLDLIQANPSLDWADYLTLNEFQQTLDDLRQVYSSKSDSLKNYKKILSALTLLDGVFTLPEDDKIIVHDLIDEEIDSFFSKTVSASEQFSLQTEILSSLCFMLISIKNPTVEPVLLIKKTFFVENAAKVFQKILDYDKSFTLNYFSDTRASTIDVYNSLFQQGYTLPAISDVMDLFPLYFKNRLDADLTAYSNAIQKLGHYEVKIESANSSTRGREVFFKKKCLLSTKLLELSSSPAKFSPFLHTLFRDYYLHLTAGTCLSLSDSGLRFVNASHSFFNVLLVFAFATNGINLLCDVHLPGKVNDFMLHQQGVVKCSNLFTLSCFLLLSSSYSDGAFNMPVIIYLAFTFLFLNWQKAKILELHKQCLILRKNEYWREVKSILLINRLKKIVPPAPSM